MGSVTWFLFVYVLGGVTFIPLIILIAFYTLPDRSKRPSSEKRASTTDPARLLRDGDDDGEAGQKLVFKTGTDDLADKFHRKHDSDVATGYFAVCREYVPGGVNGKPPDKLSPAGEAVAQESPSVYQSMYRSIFDRSLKPTIEPNKDGTGKAVKRANNIFYVVLRHGHLMLYDDIQQLEVRYVISLEYHDVDIYGGEEEDEMAEAELWIKRNAIRLRRRAVRPGDATTSLPFFFFSDNLSEKEDFYHAILANQEKKLTDLPVPQDFDTQHIITLVQKLHSSEEQLQTRWLNAMLGRLFLALYRTPFLERLVREKLTKKISRVKKPNFITRLALQKIDPGTGAPFITNPRLKDLTVNGECVIEADLDYTGCFRIEIAATARIELGTRFKAREVDMILAVTCKKLSGHMLVRFKPTPSNRLWFTFEKMPKVEMTLEPIVSSRPITYTLILKAIESRIMEVIAEAIVLPYWDDMPFLDTSQELYRGGIWKKEPPSNLSTEIKDESPEAESEAHGDTATIHPIKKGDRNMSMPVLAGSSSLAAIKAARKSVSSFNDAVNSAMDERRSDRKSSRSETSRASRSSSVNETTAALSWESKSSRPETPRVMRSSSFARAAHPAVSPTHADGDSARDIKAAEKRDHMLKDISMKSLGSSPEGTSLPAEPAMATAFKGRASSNASSTASPPETADPASVGSESMSGDAPNPFFDRTDTTVSDLSSHSSLSKSSPFSADRKHALAASAISAAQAAQRWGWGVLARTRQRDGTVEVPPSPTHLTTPVSVPMGRGRPLPPPGTPLPPPDRPSLFSMPRRKPIPSPIVSARPAAADLSTITSEARKSSPRGTSTPPEYTGRRRRQTSIASHVDLGADDEVLVVEAPTESNPTSPTNEHHDEFFGHGEGEDTPEQSSGLGIINETEQQGGDTVEREHE